MITENQTKIKRERENALMPVTGLGFHGKTTKLGKLGNEVLDSFKY